MQSMSRMPPSFVVIAVIVLEKWIKRHITLKLAFIKFLNRSKIARPEGLGTAGRESGTLPFYVRSERDPSLDFTKIVEHRRSFLALRNVFPVHSSLRSLTSSRKNFCSHLHCGVGFCFRCALIPKLPSSMKRMHFGRICGFICLSERVMFWFSPLIFRFFIYKTCILPVKNFSKSLESGRRFSSSLSHFRNKIRLCI